MIDGKKIELLLFILIVAVIALIIVYIYDYYSRRNNKKKKTVYETKVVEETIVKPIVKVEAKYACENCGARVDEDAIKCPSCGSYFEDEDSDEELEYSCNNCGTVVDEDTIICPNCGYYFEEETENYQNVEEIEIPEPIVDTHVTVNNEIKAGKIVRKFLAVRALQYFGVVIGCSIVANIFSPTFIAFLFALFAIICLVTVVEFTFMLLKSFFIDFSYEQSIRKIERTQDEKLSLDFKVNEHIAWLYSNPKKIQMVKNQIVRYYLAKSEDNDLISEKLKTIEPNA